MEAAIDMKIVSNLSSKVICLMSACGEIPDGFETVGPYRAMYDYRYRGHSWEDNNLEPTLGLLRESVGDPDWEEYLYSIIVKEGTSDDEVDLIIEEAGYVPDYILERNSGEVTLLHQTDHIKDLVDNGYYSIYDETDYSFGKGLYCLDKANFEDVKDGWVIEDNVYTGIYNGEYLRCIEDTDTGGKSGDYNVHEQEILVPFNEKSIKWGI